MPVKLNFDFKIGVSGFQEVHNAKTGQKDLLLMLQKAYPDGTQSKEVYMIMLTEGSKKNFLDFVGLKGIEDFQ